MAFAEFGHFDAAVAVKDCEKASALSVDVVVGDVRVFHRKAPALH